ncbi:MAG: helix-turn-helix domain-containing protein [Clostridia bacterium]|jgi:transcriptional regulator with XRE-family HTH domain|nr:helix-turn-helix domain-containing protein [Clostridia bacterium]
MVRVGKRLKIIRKRLGLTQKEFASRVPGRIEQTYVGKLEQGRQYPSLQLLERIGRTFNVSLGYFFEDHSFLKLFDLLPEEVRGLLDDKRLQRLLVLAGGLNGKDLEKVCRIVEILTEKEKEAEA